MTNDVDFTIAILDDRPKARESLLRGIRPTLPPGWAIIICPLQKEIENYPKWLTDHRVCVLLLDYLLDEQTGDAERLVNYRGDEVMKVLRQKLPDLPIVVVTSAGEDPAELFGSFGQADEIIKRTEMLRHAKEYVARLLRHGASFVNRCQQQLAKLGELAERSATGKLQAHEVTALKALQQALALPVESLQIDLHLNQVEDELRQLKDLECQLRKKLK